MRRRHQLRRLRGRRIRRWRPRGGQRRWRLLALPLLAAIALLLLDAAIRPALYPLAAMEGHNAAQERIHTAAQAVIAEQAQALAAATQVVLGPDQRVTGITTDAAQLNLLKAQVTAAIEAAFAAEPRVRVRIPLGAATRLALLAGRGPLVPVRIAWAATVETDFESVFSAAGVNQTLHSVLLHVRAQVTVFLPRGQTTQEIETSFCAAQTVIVGTVPDVSINR